MCFGEQLAECSVVYVLVRRRSNVGEGTLGVDELIGDRVVELRVVGLITCEGVRVVKGDEAPLGGVAQVILHGVRVVEIGVREEGEKEKDREVQVEVERGRRESKRNAHHGWHGDDGERLKDDLSQCGVTRDQQRKRTLNGALMCSLIHVAHVVLCVLVLVGVGGVTVVHIGHDEVLVVI